MNILKGDISITDNLDFTREVIFNNSPTLKIIAVEENGAISRDHRNVVDGRIFLPPIESMMAEVDGNRAAYEMNYVNLFCQPQVDEFVGSIISSLMLGNDILVYVDDLNSNATRYMMDIFFKRYGIMFGVAGSKNHYYDLSCIPMWLKYALKCGIINGRDYLYALPVNTPIPNDIMESLIMEFRPYCKTYVEAAAYINSLVYKFKEKPALIFPVYKEG